MVFVPGGEFFKGQEPNDEGMEAGKVVAIRPFFIDVTEVTVSAYKTCVGAKACVSDDHDRKGCNLANAKGRPDHPINCVSWEMANAFCSWRRARLPTAAEWERAARNGDRRKYPWGNSKPTTTQACWRKQGTCPVGTTKGQSPYGVLDLAGNVAEWTSTAADVLPGPGYVVKGGGFSRDPLDTDGAGLRVDVDHPAAASDAGIDMGFRCARDL
jgi:formylglycine-generating enzyme required for sulfatase activity